MPEIGIFIMLLVIVLFIIISFFTYDMITTIIKMLAEIKEHQHYDDCENKSQFNKRSNWE